MNKLAQGITLVSCSNVGWDTGYFESGLTAFLSSSRRIPGKCLISSRLTTVKYSPNHQWSGKLTLGTVEPEVLTTLWYKPQKNKLNEITRIRSWFLTAKQHAVLIQKTIALVMVTRWTWNLTRDVKFKILRAFCIWNPCNSLSRPSDHVVECHAQSYKSLLTHHKHSSLRVTSHIGQVFSSPITGAKERLWQRKKWKDKSRTREKGLESKGNRRKSEPGVWTRRDNKRHVSISVLTLTIQFLFMRNRFFVRSGREFWRGEKAFLGERKERQEHSCGKLFSFILTLHTSCFKDTMSSFTLFPSCMSQSLIQTASYYTSRWQHRDYCK